MAVEAPEAEELAFTALGAALLDGIGADAWHDRIEVCSRFRREIAVLLVGLHRAGVIGCNDIHAAPPAACDLCQASFQNRMAFVEGLRADFGWSRMCLDCFFAHGKAVHCDTGRLYARYGDLWQCVGGGDLGLPRWRLAGCSEQVNHVTHDSSDEGLGRRLSRRIVDLNLSIRTSRCLAEAGINTIGELLEKHPEELRAIPTFGVRSLHEVRDVLRSLGFESKIPE